MLDVLIPPFRKYSDYPNTHEHSHPLNLTKFKDSIA